MTLTLFFNTWSGQGIHMTRHVNIFMKLTASFNMFKRECSGQGRGLITPLHLKCYISCPTWPDIRLWIFKPDIICSCQYCLVRYRPTSVHVLCVLTILMELYYKSQKVHSECIVNVDFMLGQRCRWLTYINPPLSIPQRKRNRSTPAQCFPKQRVVVTITAQMLLLSLSYTKTSLQ